MSSRTVQEQHIYAEELSGPPSVTVSYHDSIRCDANVEMTTAANGTSSQMQDTSECTHEEPIHGAAHPSGRQERTHNAEEEFIQDLISSPDRIRVRKMHALLLCMLCTCLLVIILQRVTKQLQRLQFSNPGPQMRSHATDS